MGKRPKAKKQALNKDVGDPEPEVYELGSRKAHEYDDGFDDHIIEK